MKWLKSKLASASDTVGFVERATASELSGWAVSRTGAFVELTLRVNGSILAVDATWSERRDVAAKLGSHNVAVGFSIQPVGPVKERIVHAIREGLPFSVIANGVALPLADGVVPALDALPKPQGNIETIQQFTISGWAATGSAPVVSFELICNGTPAECAVIRKERRDVAEALQIEELAIGFELELPGYIWENTPEDGVCRLELRGDGALITSRPIELTRAKAAGWIAAIARMEEGREKQYRALLALEHVRFGGLLHRLDGETGLFVSKIVRQMHLEDFVFAGEAAQAQTEDAPAEYASTLLLWKTMSELNAELEDSGEGKYEAVRKTLAKHRLHGIAKEWYLNLAVQVTCASGEFLRLRKSEDFRYLHQFEESSQPHQLSLLLPLLVADGYIERATNLLVRISTSLDASWLHTECVRFAIEHFQRLEAEGEVDIPAGEKFRLAFIGLLDRHHGEWFSRLHDRELIDTMISLLAGLPHYTDYHKRDVVAAAIRLYGLCPTFWQRLAVRLPELPDAELIRAEAAWQSLRAALELHHFPPADRLEELLEPIAYFLRHGNPETLMVLREVVANSLPMLNRGLSAAGKTLIETVLSSDPVEALRIAAFPFAEENALQTRFPETGDVLLRTLRWNAGHVKSDVYELQCAAAGILRSAQEAAKAGDLDALEASLAQLERKTIALNNGQGGFLGADLLASAYILSVNAGLAADNLLMRLGEHVRKMAYDSTAEGYLPPPAYSALERLAGMKGDPALRGFLAEMQAVIRGKFGPKHDDLFKPVTAPTLVAAGTGWPQDTLVAIYSCRKYLETRVKAIRETWVRDLKARGIPYVVLVGEGDDTLKDDVLALNVSDRYEDLPRKTLKLFDWVYRNTDAHYVLKIDDDCYLDAARYFDTLSYRKHYYYGRVIRREVGALDRAWHQSRSHTSHGKKTIDKSPEPSVYADGQGAYCLSRFALLHLRKAAATEAGKRLIAGSYREDKLVGDLLALARIPPHDEDYETHQRQRTHENAMPVAMGANSFFPGRHTPTKVLHLASEDGFSAAREKSREEAVWPKKIWPACWKPAIKSNSNQLELISDAKQSERLMVHDLVVVAVVRNEMIMLPHFFEYYRRLGVKCFIFVDNCSDDGTREYLVSQPDAVVYSADTEYKHSHYGVTWQQAVMGNHCLGKWVLLADADEFLVYENSETIPLPELIGSFDAEKSNGALICMIDMYPYGDLDDARFEKAKPFDAASYFDKKALIELRFGGGSYSNSRNFVNGLRHRIAPSRINAYVSQKYALFRYQPWIRLTEGVHYAANLTVSEKPVFFAHFKYHAGFKSKVLTEIRRNQHFNGAEEYHRYAVMLTEGKGGFGVEGVTERYQNSLTFLNIFRELHKAR
jgi:hypothetical protein